ncbi:MAG: RDD family protein [Cytophaga sp.]|nr:RDD family protein [Cytophaga sp.]
MNYASFGQRLVAIIIDSIIIWLLQMFIIVPLLAAIGIGAAGGMSTMDMEDPEQVGGLVAVIMAMAGTYFIVAMAVQILYFTFMESSKTQATVGKLAMGIKVTDLNGNKLDFGKAFVRNLCRLLSNFTFLIGYIIAAFTEKKQALHDIIAGTLVVKKDQATQI